MGSKAISEKLIHGTMEEEQFIDIRTLKQDTNYFAFDPSLKNTACTQSAICYVDSDVGKLTYRGYPIEQLAENCRFTEIAYLLLNENLPNQIELESFEKQIQDHTMVHEQLCSFFNGFRRDSHPMSIMIGVVGALSSFYHDTLDMSNPDNLKLNCIRILSKMPTIAAMCYKYSIGQPFIYPKNELSYTENFLHMMFATPCAEYEIDSDIAEAMDILLTLHAEHEQNASTTSVRVAASTGANIYACIASGVTALWGPLHGGANQAVLEQLEQIGSSENIDKFIRDVKNPETSTRLMGFGHRVYKHYDPRAKIVQNLCHKILRKKKLTDPFFELALKLEEIALKDNYFTERKLYPNVDFYSGIIFKALDIPKKMFPVMFAVARTVGWLAHLTEQVNSKQPIYRPRQLYIGPKERSINRL